MRISSQKQHNKYQSKVFSLALLRRNSFKKLLFPDLMVISVLVSATRKATFYFQPASSFSFIQTEDEESRATQAPPILSCFYFHFCLALNNNPGNFNNAVFSFKNVMFKNTLLYRTHVLVLVLSALCQTKALKREELEKLLAFQLTRQCAEHSGFHGGRPSIYSRQQSNTTMLL